MRFLIASFANLLLTSCAFNNARTVRDCATSRDAATTFVHSAFDYVRPRAELLGIPGEKLVGTSYEIVPADNCPSGLAVQLGIDPVKQNLSESDIDVIEMLFEETLERHAH